MQFVEGMGQWVSQGLTFAQYRKSCDKACKGWKPEVKLKLREEEGLKLEFCTYDIYI